MEPQRVVKDSETAKRHLKQAREKVDLTQQQEGFGWLKTRQLAVKMFGKEKGLTIGECRKLVGAIREQRGRA